LVFALALPLAGLGVVLAPAREVAALPPNPIFPVIVTSAALSDNTLPPNPVVPVEDRGAYVAGVAQSCNVAEPTDPVCAGVIIVD
jgi:hypothetical protein